MSNGTAPPTAPSVRGPMLWLAGLSFAAGVSAALSAAAVWAGWPGPTLLLGALAIAICVIVGMPAEEIAERFKRVARSIRP